MLAVRTGKGDDGVRGLKAGMAGETVGRVGGSVQLPMPRTGQGRDPAMFTEAL
jgi:hypothetical protein